jgi:hypothetical protein
MTKMNLRCDLAKDICAQSLLVAQTMTSSNLNFYISHGNMKDPASSFLIALLGYSSIMIGSEIRRVGDGLLALILTERYNPTLLNLG